MMVMLDGCNAQSRHERDLYEIYGSLQARKQRRALTCLLFAADSSRTRLQMLGI